MKQICESVLVECKLRSCLFQVSTPKTFYHFNLEMGLEANTIPALNGVTYGYVMRNGHEKFQYLHLKAISHIQIL